MTADTPSPQQNATNGIEKRLRTAYDECLGRSMPHFGLDEWNGYWDALRAAQEDAVAELVGAKESSGVFIEAFSKMEAAFTARNVELRAERARCAALRTALATLVPVAQLYLDAFTDDELVSGAEALMLNDVEVAVVAARAALEEPEARRG